MSAVPTPIWMRTNKNQRCTNCNGAECEGYEINPPSESPVGQCLRCGSWRVHPLGAEIDDDDWWGIDLYRCQNCGLVANATT